MDDNSFNNNPNNPYRPQPDAGAPLPSDYGQYQQPPAQTDPYSQGSTSQFSPNPAPSGSFQPTAPVQPLGLQPKKFIFAGWTTMQLVIFIVISLLAVTFIGLFIWMFTMWSNADKNVQSRVDSAVAAAVNETETELQAKFEEEQKYPYNTFTGPADYGELTFEYPKTWSAYISKDAATGGNFEAYLNPDVVSPVSNDTINALRVTIEDQSIDQVSRSYENLLRQNRITVAVRPINGENANVYTGSLTNNIQGIAAIFKIRDKTAIIQTDAMIFQEDFTHVLDTIKYNN